MVFPILVLFLFSNNANADITSSLVGHWSFDEGSGSTALDSSGNGNTASFFNGPSWGTGIIGGAVSFDGIDDYIDCGNNSILASSQGSLSVWYKPASINANQDLIYLYEFQYSDYLLLRQVGFRNGGIRITVEDDNISDINNTTAVGIGDTDWHHIAVTQDGSGVAMYIDGVVVSHDGTDGTAWSGHLNANNCWIGKSAWGTFEGLIDDIRIYSRALSASDISELYNNTGGGDSVCEDGLCNGTETCDSCSSDCGTCPFCGDEICDVGEDCVTCTSDCGECPVYQCSDGLDNDNDSYTDYPNDPECGSLTDDNEYNESPDTISPSTPANLTASAVSSSQVDLSWTASTDNIGVIGYRLYRNSVYANNTPNTIFSDTNLNAETTYNYIVSAYDTSDNESAQSLSTQATTLEFTGFEVIAVSCSALDIQAAIDTVITAGGGTARIPACRADNTWVSTDYISAKSDVPYQVIGAGISDTIIGYQDGQAPASGKAPFYFEGTGMYEIAHFTIRGSDTAKIATGLQIYANPNDSGGADNLRVHHMGIKKFSNSGIYLCPTQNPFPTLIDHCEIGDQYGTGMYGIRVHGSNPEAANFIIPASFGINNPNAVFIEDNIFDSCYHSISGFAVSNIVLRHNTILNPNSYIDGHGPCFDTGCYRDPGEPDTGTYIYEIYDNTINCGSYPWGINIRGGTGIVTDNIFLNCNVDMRLEMESCSAGVSCSIDNDCPHSNTNDSDCYQSPYQWWIWENTHSIGADIFESNDKDTGCIRENYEYYLRSPQTGDPVASYSKHPYPHPLISGEIVKPEDTSAPSGYININSGNQYTNIQNTSLSFSATDPSGVTEMKVSNDNNFNSPITSVYNKLWLWTLSVGDGIKTVYVWFKDAIGNWNTNPASDTIILDTTAPIISTVKNSEINTYSAIITWSTNENSTSQIEFGFTSGYGTIYPQTDSTSDLISHSVVLSSLSAGATYNYRIISADTVGNTTNSINRTFTTNQSQVADTTAPANIVNLNSSSITQISISLSWSAPGDDENTGTAASYDARYSVSSITEANWNSATELSGEPIPKVAGAPQSAYIVIGLSPATTYYFAVKTADEVPNWSALSNSVEVSTLVEDDGGGNSSAAGSFSGGGSGSRQNTYADITPPSQPAEFKATPAESQITLNWINPVDSDFVRVIIIKKEGSEPTSKDDGENIYEGIGEEYTDINLDNNTTYHYAIFAFDQKPNYSNLLFISSSPEAGKESVIKIFKEINERALTEAELALTHLAKVDSEIVERVTEVESNTVYGYNQRVNLDDTTLQIYEKISKDRNLTLSNQAKYAVAYFIHIGTPTTRRLGSGERAGVINSYFEAFNHLPQTAGQWRDVIKIANGRWPAENNKDKENQSKTEIFKKVYLRNPDMNNPYDNAAITITTYGLRPVERNMDSEKSGIRIFKSIYKHNPSSAGDWDIVRAISYSGATR